MDFGIARHALLADDEPDLSPEAAFYAPPEQAGALGGRLDGRADLYALGVTLYECLSRRPPFVGERIGDVLRQHLTSSPPALAELVPGVPRALAEIVGRLLRKDPRDRYQTAEGALADLRALADALRAGEDQPAVVVGARDRRHALTEPAFIGRTGELDALGEALASARAGRGGLALVEAESGRGKSWLLEELAKQARASGASVLRGCGLDRAAQQPFHVLPAVARELRSELRRAPAWSADLAARLGDARGPIAAAMPELAPVFSSPERASLGPEEHGQERTLSALASLLDALGAPERTVVLLVDDGQWADDATLRLLERWQAQPPPPAGRHVLVVVSFRSEEVADGHPLRRTPAAHHLCLRPFDPADVRRQLASMAGQLPEEAIDTVTRHAGGNPFLVGATLHGLVEAGALAPDGGGWRYDPRSLGELQAAARAADVLAVRLHRLEEEPLRLLTVGALLGRTFDPALAGALAGIEPRRALEVAEAWRGRLVWADGAGASFTFLHDRIREALLGRLSEGERRRLHHMAAERLLAAGGDRSFELAYHFDAAGEPERALPHALAAAESSRARFALELAERHYRIAARGAVASDRPTRHRIARGLAEVLTLRESFAEAATWFEQAVALAPDARARAQTEERWSHLDLKQGRLAAACAHAETALRLMGRWIPKSPLFVTVWCLWEPFVQVLHDRFPRVFVGRRKLEGADDELFAARVFHSLNGPYFFSKGAEWAAWAHLRHLNLAERYEPSLELARAYTVHAGVTAGFPALYERTLRVNQIGYELSERLGDLWGQAQALCFRSGTLHFMGRWAESIEAGEKGAALFERTGDRWEADTGLDFALTSVLQSGDLTEALAFARYIHGRSRHIGDMGDAHALAWSLDAWTRATEGKNVPAELIAKERARTAEHIQTSSIVEMAEGVRLLGHDRPAEALEVLEQATERYRREARFFHDLNAPLIVYQATALRTLAASASPWNPAGRQRLIRKWRRAARAALKIARRFQNNLPHALREGAFLAAFEGRPESARRQIEESPEVAERRGMRYERALSRLARAELGAALGWADAAADLEAARAAREAMLAPVLAPPADAAPAGDSPVTLSLIDRFATLLEAGRQIATALSTDAVLPALREAALALLRADRCLIVGRPAGGTGHPEPLHGDAGGAFCPELVTRALAERRAVIASDTEGGGVRSALAVPIFVRGEAFGCLYVAHREVGGLFGDNESRIGEFLAALAGAALENAEGVAQIQAFSRDLETRVAARTAELAQANQELATNLEKLAEAQEQLVQAGKMAAVGTLIAGLSHELNNPMAIILGYAQGLLQQLPDDAPAAAPLRAIERQALRCRHLVHTLLNFSHMKSSARQTIAPEVLFADIIELASAKARTCEVDLHVEPTPDPLVPVHVSLQGIQSVLLNLIANAIDASPPGSTVVLSARAAARGREAGVEIAVRDRGHGIPANARPHVFDPFYTTRPVGRGTGLGLSLARQIVLDRGGRIELDSAEGRGTTAVVWLPAAVTRPAPPEEARP